jgi:hypothetical protein
MKTLLKVLLGLAVFGAIVVALVFWMTSGLPRAADKFFTHIAANEYDAALAMTTPDFRASTDKAALEAFARSNGLDGYKSASWSSRSMDNSVGELEGTLTVAGGSIPIKVTLVKDDGEWHIQNVRKADAGMDVDSGSAPSAPATEVDTTAPAAAPSAEEQQQLVAGTLSAFAESVNADDFSMLHGTGSTRFREQVSVDKLHETFAGFVEQKIDLSVLDTLTPGIDASSGIQPDGNLHLTGSYDTKPSGVHFDLLYELEDGQWSLININVKVE